MNLAYAVKRHVPAAKTEGGPEDSFIAIVMFAFPGDPPGQMRHLAVSEDLIRFKGGRTEKGEQQVIEHELTTVITQLSAGSFNPNLILDQKIAN